MNKEDENIELNSEEAASVKEAFKAPHVDFSELDKEVGKIIEAKKPTKKPLLFKIAAAAAAVIFIGIITTRNDIETQYKSDKVSKSKVTSKDAKPGDLNFDGDIDIIDAHYLAKKIKAKGKTNKADDVNNDGKVNEDDIETLKIMIKTSYRNDG